MKGVMFNILEDFLEDRVGEERTERIFTASDISTREPFVAPGTYPDGDFLAIIGESIRELGCTQQDFMRQLGHFAFFKLVERYPVFVTPYQHPKDFLKTIEKVVHVEVKKLYTDTYLPTFVYEEPSEQELIITYYSKRKLYHMMEGLIGGVAEYFDYTIDQTHRIYTRDGVEFCDFHLNFVPGNGK
ncbi:heme NO-binding domain-containing protein [Neolewinella litorea]|uniref:Heme NO-binding domain-containing protein n=1 Tax=Neolewinella litorea TaxID=2562452 RepID=A0A4S4N8Q3_9BACT|nr:heme NO-binding domain-containing protein [Neolewinella litorea]THH35604.1 hypothetical protein E4021_16070 [Neolewinella litorea]